MTVTLDILERLIAFDTVSARSNLALIDYVETYLRGHGFEVSRLADPTEPKAGLFAQIGPDGPGVALSAHTDVVPVEGQDWTRDPFRLSREGDRLYGRGATDMKGFLASMLAAAARASAAPLNEPLKLAISYDEEIGCVGVARMMDRLGPMLGRPRACIVGEPTEMRVAIGHKGKHAFRAVCRGEPGHSALAPRFANALHVAADFMSQLRALQDRIVQDGPRDAAYDIPYTTIHVGALVGGTALNMVPDRAEILFELRSPAAESIADLRAAIDAAAARALRPHGPVAGLELSEMFAYPGLETSETAEIALLLRALTGDGEPTKVAFGTEAGFFAALDIPTVVCGPGSMEGQGHKPDEYVEAAQLAACDAMLDGVLRTLTA